MEFQKLTPVEYAAHIISQYIFEMKQVQIRIAVPIQQKDEKKFIQAFNVACNYYGITI
jgi:hypothetical protein